MPANSPLVSVYVPTHNRLTLLKRAVASVLRQSFPDYEILIVDDASSDGTPEYLSGLEREHGASVRCFRLDQSQGACVARNLAIRRARGRFVTGLDDDDEFLPHRLESLMRAYDPRYAFVCSGFYWHYGRFQRKVDAKRAVINLDRQLSYNEATSQVLVERERLLAVGGFDAAFVACQDYDTWTRLIREYGDGLRIGDASYVVHCGHDGPRITDKSQQFNGYWQFYQKHEGRMSNANKQNQKFMRMVAREERLPLVDLPRMLLAGKLRRKVRYFLSSNLTSLAALRTRLLRNQ